MKHIVEIENWVRRENYLYLKNFAIPWIAITSDLDCNYSFHRDKKSNRSFFLY